MKATEALHNLGQSIWLDNITRDLLNSGTLKRYIDEWSVTGLTSNPTISTTPSKIAPPTTAPSAKSSARANPARLFSSNWRLRTSRARPRCFGRSMTKPAGSTAGYRWKFRRCWPMTPPAVSRPPGACMSEPGSPTCLSRFPGPRKVCPRLRKRSLPASRSTLLYCFRGSIIWPPPMHTCAAWNGGSSAGFRPALARSRRYSSAGGTSQ